MILIVGGAWQGKLDFARELAGKKNAVYELCQVAEGSTDSFEAALDCRIIHGFHEYVRRVLKENKSVEAFIEKIQAQNPEVIITSNELGCGIVPVDREDREWRETSGRASVRLAKSSDQVYRLVCGIASRIK